MNAEIFMKIKEVFLETSHLPELLDFYVQRLGFALQTQEEGKFTLIAGTSLLHFEQAKEVLETSPFYHFAFNIPENQFGEAQSWLKNKSLEILPFQGQQIIDFPNWNAHSLYFLDPAGNILELIARHDLPNAIDQPFNASSICEISEVGFPVPEIAPFYQDLHQQFGLPMYSQISNLNTFCAAGDPQGLFIIVPLNRAWFPTQRINGIFHIRILMEGTGKQIYQNEALPYSIETV